MPLIYKPKLIINGFVKKFTIFAIEIKHIKNISDCLNVLKLVNNQHYTIKNKKNPIMKAKKFSFLIIVIFAFSFLNGSAQTIYKKSNTQQKDVAYIQGNVTDANTGDALANVGIIAETYFTQTNASGYYLMETSSGVYDVLFKKFGYQDFIEEGLVTIPNDTIIVNVQLWEELYAPHWVIATKNLEDTECDVEWWSYNPEYEIIYDDGQADDYFCWTIAGNANAVKFTPLPWTYPVNITGGKVYVGDGSFPSGANFLGTTFKIIVFDDDGPDGFPGTKLDSVEVVVNNYFWVDFNILDATIYDGDFYIAMFQQTIPPDVAPVGIDYTIPTAYRSYNYDACTDIWALSPYQDFMIRAIVTAANEKELQTYPAKEKLLKPENKNIASRDVTGYKIVRYSDFDPDSIPSSGTTNLLLENTLEIVYSDTAFGGLEGGWYAYGVAARYDQNGYVWSDYTISNIVGHNNYFDVRINVSTSNGENADSAEIVLTGIDYPYIVNTAITDTSATELFSNVWKGFYNLNVIKQGYEEYVLTDFLIDKNDTIDVVLEFTFSIDEVNSGSIKIFPNPATDIINISSPEIIEQIKLIDNSGKVVYEKDEYNRKSISINTATFKLGVYYVSVLTEKEITIEKVVIN